ncbi:MAG: hypothetical protein ACXWIN_10035 [Burkholderiaceae bacterium]
MNKLFLATLFAASTMALTAPSFAADTTATATTADNSQATYTAAKDNAKAEYKIARAKCNSLSGNGKDVCVKEAKASRDKAIAVAEFEHKGTLNAFTTARKDVAQSDYSVAKEKCDDKNGNAKDVCLKEAKSEKVAATADAKTDKKIVNAVVDGNNDKVKAEYKVAIEKCDAFAGAAKDNCVATAKTNFGK